MIAHKMQAALRAGLPLILSLPAAAQANNTIGREASIAVHLKDGDEVQMPISDLLAFGSQLFQARWTTQEGQGRPLTKGTGSPLSDPSSPLTFPRNFDRLSGPDSNSCFGCHNTPFAGGGGDRVSEVFVLGQRFDFLNFDHSNASPTRGATDERGIFIAMPTEVHGRASTLSDI